MLAYPDLFAFDAKYHRSCYGHYISGRNIKATRDRNEHAQSQTVYESTLRQLFEEMEMNILSNNKSVVLLSDLQNRFVQLLQVPTDVDAEGYSSWKLKEKMKNYFGSKIIFISQSGKSYFVCSNKVTVGDALKKVKELQVKVGETGNFELSDNSQQPEDSSTLHRAAGIIRKAVEGTSFHSNEYSPSGHLELDKCKAFVPAMLLDFVYWCTSTRDYCNASHASERGEDLLSVIAICQNIIALTCSIQTPITFGLGVQVYHDFGSKRLIEMLNSIGYSISYDDTRRFVTSVAKDQLSKSEIYIPLGISPFNSEDLNSTIHAAIDNFDRNEDTIDGKSSTHCMAVVLYQRLPKKSESSGIPRTFAKSLDVTEYEEQNIQRYAKPHKKPDPPRASNISIFKVQKGESYASSQLKDLVWGLTRKLKGDRSSVPAWSGFNTLTSDVSVSIPVTTIRYLPFIHAPPSDFSTIFTTLLKLALIAHHLGQEHILVTADLAIYSKAQHILWNKPEQLDGKLTMRLGGMHLTMAFIAAIGKLFSDGGLQEMFSSSGLFATSSAIQMLQGKHYARALHGLKIVHEALLHLYLTSAETYARANGLPWVDNKTIRLINGLDACFQEKDSAMMKGKCLEIEDRMAVVLGTITRFQEDGRNQSATFAFWDSYIEAVSVLLRLIRADREADFMLHLDAVLETVPFFFLAGRVNYARYTPVYVLEMKKLELTHPLTYQHLKNGGFVVRRRNEATFNCIPTDQALEQTINREAKGDGGVIGFTLRKSALLRWLLTRHVTGEYAEAFKRLCISKRGRKEHEELGKVRMTRDLADVSKVEGYILNHCQNPFNLTEVPKRLVNIVSGQVASAGVEESLRSLPIKGTNAYDKFVNERLVGGKQSFWDAITKKAVLTFTDMKRHLSYDKEKQITINTEVLFRRLLAVAKNRDVNLKMVLSYELAGVPPCLFHDDGAMRKTNKADLAKKLESMTNEILDLPCGNNDIKSAYIVDGMAMIQALNEDHFKTFNDLGEIITKRLIRVLKSPTYQANILILVFDRYDCVSSVKSDERQRRGVLATGMSTSQTHHIIGNRTVPHFRQFLKGAGNKPYLAEFVSTYVVDNTKDHIPSGKLLILAGGFKDGQRVVKVSCDGSEDIHEYFSCQEEADTRMVLHAVHLAPEYQRTIIRTDDTDVLVILLRYCSLGMMTEEVYMHAGHAGKFVTRERYIPVHTIASELGKDICQCLPSVHALTGCDSTNSLFGIGKKSALSVLCNLSKSGSSVLGLGQFDSVNDWLESARIFVLGLYGNKGKKCKSLDELRHLYATTTDKPSTQLPPTEDAFMQHAHRARYQSMIWCTSHVAKPALDEPTNHGWYRDTSGLHPVMFTQESAPTEVRDITHLYCKDGDCRQGSRCACLLAGLKCINLCNCENCPNVASCSLDLED